MRHSGYFSLLFEELDGIADRLNLFGSIIRDFAPELFLECHDQLDDVEAVGTEIVDEAGFLGDLVGEIGRASCRERVCLAV